MQIRPWSQPQEGWYIPLNADLTHKYRADIDGLRALAVLSVIAFHMQTQFGPCGFVGVDVFCSPDCCLE